MKYIGYIIVHSVLHGGPGLPIFSAGVPIQGSQHSGKIREKLEKLKKSGKTWKTQ